MGDDKAKPKENPRGQPETPDVLKLGQVKTPEKAPQIVAEKTDVKKETTKEASEIKREVLQMQVNPDKDTPSKIDRLDVNGNLESKEQKEGFEALQIVTVMTLVPMLLKHGLKKEQLHTFENINQVGGDMAAKLNPAERISLKKIQEIAGKPGTIIHGALKERWQKMVNRGHELYEGAQKAYQQLNGQTPKGTPEKKEEPTFWGKIGNFVKDHPLLSAGIAVAGAYGVYKIFKWFTSDEEETGEKKEGFLDKILGGKWATRLKWGLGIFGGIFVLGRLIGNEDVSRWLKDKLGINITGNRLSQFIMLISEGKFIEAFKVLFTGPDENLEVHRRMAGKISKEMGTEVKPETLKRIGNIKYEEFMSIVAEGKSAAVGLLGQIPGLSLIVGSAEDAEQEKIVRQYFLNHETEINHFKNPTTTVDNVLTALDGETPLPPAAPEVTPIIAAIDQLPPETQEMGKELKEDLKRLIDENEIKKRIVEAKKHGINTEKVEGLLAERKKALADLLKSIENKEDGASIADKADKVFKLNEQLGEACNDLTEEIMKRRGWTETQLLAATHLPRYIGWFRMPAYKKEYGKYLLTKYLKAPVGLAKDVIGKRTGAGIADIVGREFKQNASVPDIEEEMRKTKAELDAAKTDQPDLDKEAKLKQNDDIVQNAAEHNKRKTSLLEKDMQIHEKRKRIAELEGDILDLKTKNAPADQIAKAERELAENKSFMQAFKNERLKLQGDFLETRIREQRLTFLKEFGNDGKKALLSKAYIEQMDVLQNQIGSHRRQIDLAIADKMVEAEKLAKEGKDIKSLAKEINELHKTRIRLDLGAVSNYQELAKSWTKNWQLFNAMKGGAVTPEAQQAMRQEKNEMQRLWNKMLAAQPEAGKSVSPGIIHTMKGKMYFYGAFMAIGSAINLADKRESELWSNAIGQAVVDTLPFVSTYSDFYSVIHGEEMITKRKLDAKDRAIRAAFGTGGALCDLSDLAGVFMRARAGYGAMKEAKTLGKSVEIGEALRAAEKEGKIIDSIEALREMSRTGHWVNKVAMAGAIGALGYSLVYQPVASITLEPETKAILGDQVKDLDIEPPKIDQPLVKAP